MYFIVFIADKLSIALNYYSLLKIYCFAQCMYVCTYKTKPSFCVYICIFRCNYQSIIHYRPALLRCLSWGCSEQLWVRHSCLTLVFRSLSRSPVCILTTFSSRDVLICMYVCVCVCLYTQRDTSRVEKFNW